MNSIEIRNLQAPLKEKYKNDPASAMITLKAKGRISEEISCTVETNKTEVIAGLHPATGGDGSLACSGDMLLQALVACAGVTLNAVATAIGIEIKEGSVYAEGDLDFRGTLGVSKEALVGFTAIRLYFNIQSNATEQQMDSLEKLTEKYCVVYQTLTKGIRIDTYFNK